MAEREQDAQPHWLLRRRGPVLGVALLLTLLLASRLPDLALDFSPQQLFETGDRDEDWANYERVIEAFGRDDNTLIVVVDGGTGGAALAPSIRRWVETLSQEVSQWKEVDRVVSLATATTVRTRDGEVEVGPAADLPPETLLADPLLRGSLVSPEGRYQALYLRLDPEVRPMARLKPAVERVRAWVMAHPPPPPATAHLAGIPFIRVDVVESIFRDQALFIPPTLLVLALILFVAFRRLSRVVAPLVTVGVGVVWVLSGMAITGTKVDIINHVLPSLLLVIGISDGLHLLVREQEEFGRGVVRTQALSTSVRTLAAACLLTSLTTAIGFASLVASTTAILRRFGLTTALGVMLLYGVTIGLLPPLVSLFGPPAKKTPGAGPLSRFALAAGRIGLQHPLMTFGVGLGLAGVFLWIGATHVHVDTKLTEVYAADHPVRAMQRTLDEKLGGVLPLDIVVEIPGATIHRDPDLLRRLAALQAAAAAPPEIASARSVADFVSRLHQALAGPEAGVLPTSSELLAQEWLVAELGEARLPTDRFVAHGGEMVRIALRAKDVGGRRLIEYSRLVHDAAIRIFGDVEGARIYLTGDAYIAARNMGRLIADLFSSLALASVVIFLSLLFMFRSLRLALVSVLPNALPLLATVAFMGLVGMSLDVTNVVVFSIALGLAVDDTIHIIARFREEMHQGPPGESVDAILERTLAGTGQAVVLTSVVLGAGMAILLLSEFVPTRRFGGLTALTLTTALVADLILLPALLHLAFRRRPVATESACPSGSDVS